MKKKLTAICFALCLATVYAGPHGHHHHHHSDLGVAADIVHIITDVVTLPLAVAAASQPVVVAQPPPVVVAPPPPPVVVNPPPPAVVVTPPPATVVIPDYSYGYYGTYWVPTWEGWYFYNNDWVWGGGIGIRPARPHWRPDFRRPAPPPPPRHHHHHIAPPPPAPAPHHRPAPAPHHFGGPSHGPGPGRPGPGPGRPGPGPGRPGPGPGGPRR